MGEGVQPLLHNNLKGKFSFLLEILHDSCNGPFTFETGESFPKKGFKNKRKKNVFLGQKTPKNF